MDITDIHEQFQLGIYKIRGNVVKEPKHLAGGLLDTCNNGIVMCFCD